MLEGIPVHPPFPKHHEMAALLPLPERQAKGESLSAVLMEAKRMEERAEEAAVEVPTPLVV